MRRTTALLAVFALAAAVGCSTLKTTADWDKTTDFSRYRTWGWKEDGSIKNDIIARRIQSLLGAELGKKGLTRADDNPDLWVAVHVRLSKETQVNYYNSGWGYGWRGGYYGGMGMSTATVQEIPVGTLVVDLVDGRAKELVWRGTATDTLKPERTPEEKEKALGEAFAKLFEKYPPPK
jgi:Domain of unknown function (DUF4136)